jgi:hypothetical protein
VFERMQKTPRAVAVSKTRRPSQFDKIRFIIIRKTKIIIERIL